MHASYVYDFLETMKPETVFCQIPPDLPYFIKTAETTDYRARWFTFLTELRDAKFYVSSKPSFASDVILNSSLKTKMFMERSIIPAIKEFEIGTKVIYSHQRGTLPSKTIRADALMTPLLYSYNNAMDDNIKTVIGDMPLLFQRHSQALSLNVD